MILFLHHRYRTTGGEERAVAALRALVRDRLGEDEDLLERDSGTLAGPAAAAGLLRGGTHPGEVAAAVRSSGARVVHAHNLLPTYGWRALAAAQEAGARTVLQLHNYRLVCAVGVCFTDGEECTRCHGRDTRPGIRRTCRGTRAEALAYGAGLALWQRRTVAHADAIVVPSAFALRRLRDLGAPLGDVPVHVVGHPVAPTAERSAAADGTYALVASRLSPEKGVDIAIEACRRAAIPLVIAGDGEQRADLERAAAGADVTFLGAVSPAEVARLRAGAALALVPSRSAETFGLAAAEAMAAGVPVVGSAVGALPELLAPGAQVPAGDPDALAATASARYANADAGDADLARVRSVAAPEVVAEQLAHAYGIDGRPSGQVESPV
ncbi:glycosyltransferase [Svornostia abyssi]|uniref:Glycosyltransferase n=1 Tax=Svornostia abyssi TaxID=2898438 RepID=A0ABY5PHL9_9ACTN|nr:glycosyltransferase [Parviterribacteraceae bacterium J379]